MLGVLNHVWYAYNIMYILSLHGPLSGNPAVRAEIPLAVGLLRIGSSK